MLPIKEPGYYTNGNNSEDAIILEVRGYLAARYNWTGRCQEITECFHGYRGVAETLKHFDEINARMNVSVN